MGVFHPIRVWVAPGPGREDQLGRNWVEIQDSWAGTGFAQTKERQDWLVQAFQGANAWAGVWPWFPLGHSENIPGATITKETAKETASRRPPPPLRNCTVSHWGSWDLTLTLAPLSPHFPHLLGWLFCSLPESLCSRGHQV